LIVVEGFFFGSIRSSIYTWCANSYNAKCLSLMSLPGYVVPRLQEFRLLAKLELLFIFSITFVRL